MTVTLEISDQLAAQLHALAAQRGLSVKVLSEQALTVGLTTLAGADEVGAIATAGSLRPPQTHALMPSPTLISGTVRPLQVTFEPPPEGSTDAH
ncbi:MAG: hypothetical protein EOM24_10540 [Chloroflexia bacterium]|nr:hypothetical protein [Chloroflexia bacterium]